MPAKSTPKTAPVRVLRAVWIDGARVEPLQVIRVPAVQARKLIEIGAVERADPLPGEKSDDD